MIARQLTESLDRLKTDVIESTSCIATIPDVPVGEFVDAMDAEVRAGRIAVYGGSNWTRERMDAAIAYAEKNGKRLPGALSNNFSLAEMVNPVWAGVLAASDDAWKAWLRTTTDPALRLVEPGARLLHRPGRPRQARRRGAGQRLVQRQEFRRDARGRSSLPSGSARTRSTSRSPIASTRISRSSR